MICNNIRRFKKRMFFVLLIAGCSTAPQPIKYGSDVCHYCSMTIVDKVHAAEVITKKGKVYKFDAVECMLYFRQDFDEDKIKSYLANDYMRPEQLVDASLAAFLISENIPSPMGAYLTAFEKSDEALQTQQQKGGTLYSWNEILIHFDQLR